MAGIEPPSISPRAHEVAEAYQHSAALLRGFDVLWINDAPTGLMLHCRVCGVHDFRPTEERPLAELFESAIGHRQVCPDPSGRSFGVIDVPLDADVDREA
jgi:hypothetical protein